MGMVRDALQWPGFCTRSRISARCTWVILAALFASLNGSPARAEDLVLRLLIWDGYAPAKYVTRFEKHIKAKYGRTVKLRISTVEGPEDFFGPIRKKEVDVVTITHHYFKDERFRYIRNKLLLPINAANISNLPKVIPALQTAEYLSADGKTYGVPVCQGPYGLAYSKSKVKAPPVSWKILWKPQYKGQYALGGNEYLYNVSMAALTWGYPRKLISSYDVLNNPGFKEKLRQLTTGAGSFWLGQDTPKDLAGKSLAGVWGDSLDTLRRQGEPWELAEPKEGTLCWIDNYAITWALADKPFLRKVAEEWINALLEPDYQVGYIVREIALGPITTGIEDKLTVKEKTRLHVGTPNFFRDNRILLPTCSRRDRNGLKLLWEHAMKGITIRKGDTE